MLPVAVGGVLVHAAPGGVYQGPGIVKCQSRPARGIFVTTGCKCQAVLERVTVDVALRLLEATDLHVERCAVFAINLLACCVTEGSGIAKFSVLVFVFCHKQRAGVFQDAFKRAYKTLRFPVAAQFADVVAVAIQNDGGGPAISLIATRQIRPRVLIDMDRNKVFGYQGHDCRVAVGGGLHDMTPVTPVGTQIHQYVFFGALGLGKCSV